MQKRRQLAASADFRRAYLVPPLLAQDNQNNTPLLWAVLRHRPAVLLFRLLQLAPTAVALTSWAGNTVAHEMVRAALFTPEAVAHANAALYGPDGQSRKGRGRSHEELLELLHQVLELWPQALDARNTAGQTVFDLVRTYVFLSLFMDRSRTYIYMYRSIDRTHLRRSCPRTQP